MLHCLYFVAVFLVFDRYSCQSLPVCGITHFKYVLVPAEITDPSKVAVTNNLRGVCIEISALYISDQCVGGRSLHAENMLRYL